MRTAPDLGNAGDDLFGVVMHAGAYLDLQPGEAPWERSGTVMSALTRIFSPHPKAQPATREDVELVLGAIPDFQVRWTGTKVELFGAVAAAARSMRGEAPAGPAGPATAPAGQRSVTGAKWALSLWKWKEVQGMLWAMTVAVPVAPGPMFGQQPVGNGCARVDRSSFIAKERR